MNTKAIKHGQTWANVNRVNEKMFVFLQNNGTRFDDRNGARLANKLVNSGKQIDFQKNKSKLDAAFHPHRIAAELVVRSVATSARTAVWSALRECRCSEMRPSIEFNGSVALNSMTYYVILCQARRI
jgi:hypothetical protein